MINIDKVKLCIDYEITKDKYKENQKSEESLKYYQDFLAFINRKLYNRSFIEGAPEKVIEIERKKKRDTKEKIDNILETINKYQNEK